MDFLSLMICYMLMFGVAVICYCYADSPLLNSGMFGWFRRSVSKCFYWIVSPVVIHKTAILIDYIFFRRNHVLQVVYGGLVLAGHMVFLLDMLPIFYTLSANQNHVLIPLVILLVNTMLFHGTCISDPGEITLTNQKSYSPVYLCDGILYETGSKCRTCLVAKIPRSKHCSVCDRCVYRFDHHCIWTNNCIGGLNHGCFILFLLSICVMCVNGAMVCYHCMELVVDHFKMLESSYLDETGTIQPVTILVLAQHLFLKFPRIVFMLVSLIFLIIAVGGFFSYHIFLAATNQTTNERYKMDYLRHLSDKGHNSTNTRNSLGSKLMRARNIYNEGLLVNLYQIALPKRFVKSKSKKTR